MSKSIFHPFLFVAVSCFVFSQGLAAEVPNPPEVLPLAPVHSPADVMSIYSGYYDNVTSINDFSGSGDKKEIAQVQGDEMVYIENGLNTWAYVNFSSPVNIDSYNSLHFDIYVVTGNFNLKVSFADGSSNFSIPVVEGWNRIHLELNDYKAMFNSPDFKQVSFIAFINDNGYKRSIFVDNIYVSNEEHPEQLLLPATPIATPQHPHANVLPIFSEAYPDNVGFSILLETPGSPRKFKGKNFTPASEVEKMFWINAGMNNGGGGFLFSSPQDVSAYDYLHIDLFLAGTNTLPLRFKFGVTTPAFTATYAPNPSATVFTAQPGWNSINVKISDFLGLATNTFDLTTMNGIGFWHKTGGTRTVYVDNIYFYKEPKSGDFCAKTSGAWSDNASWLKWSGTTWQDAAVNETPISSSDVYIDAAEINMDVSSSVSNLTLGSSGKLTITTGHILSIAGDFKSMANEKNTTGTLVDENPAGGLLVSGQVNVDQFLQGGRNWYISSPVANAPIDSITGKTGNVLYEYVEANNSWPAASAFTAARGYVAAIEASNTGFYTFTASDLNQGPQTITLSRTPAALKAGYNLIGNPYLSYLNMQSIVNATDGLSKSVWYRVKNTANTAYFFDTFNTTSGLGTNNNGKGNVSGTIPPFQAVWVRVAPEVSSVDVELTHDLRSHNGAEYNPLRSPGTDQQRVLRLEVSNASYADETIIYFNRQATDDLDSYDSPKMTISNASGPEIQTKADNEFLAINGMSESALFREIPLYFTASRAGEFRLRVKEMSGFGDMYLSLTDTETNTEFVLDDEYFFSSDVADFAERFVLKVSAATTGTFDKDAVSSAVFSPAQGKIQINLDRSGVDDAMVTVYTTMGQLLYTGRLTDHQTTINIQHHGLCLVTLEISGIRRTNKIIVK